jgi:hypothetical protein
MKKKTMNKENKKLFDDYIEYRINIDGILLRLTPGGSIYIGDRLVINDYELVRLLKKQIMNETNL